MILLHSDNEQGFVPGGKLVFKAGSSDGDYHSEMNHQNFQDGSLRNLSQIFQRTPY